MPTCMIIMQVAVAFFLFLQTCFAVPTDLTHVPVNRTNVCAIVSKLYVSNYTTSQLSLKGYTFNVAYSKGLATNKAYLMLGQVDGVDNRPIDGFLFNLYEAIAALGGFKFNYVMTPNEGSEGDDLYLYEMVSRFDSILKPSFDTFARRQAGIGFTPGVLDGSLVLITNSTTNFKTIPPNFDPLSWLAPFGYDLWGAIVGAIIFHACIQCLLEYTEYYRRKHDICGIPSSYGDNEQTADEIEEPQHIIDYAYQSFGTFSGAGGHDPQWPIGKYVYVIFSFFCLILVASYTANLASDLIVNSQASEIISSITDFENNPQFKLGFRKGAAALNLTLAINEFEHITTVSSALATNTDLLAMLDVPQGDAHGNTADGIVMAINDWQTEYESKDNPGCVDMQTGLQSIKTMAIVLPFRVDQTEYCTSAFGYVFSELLNELNQQGAIEELWNTALASIAVESCSTHPPPSDSPNQLTLKNMSGLFSFYFSAVCSGLGLYILHLVIMYSLRARLMRKDKAIDKPSNSNASKRRSSLFSAKNLALVELSVSLLAEPQSEDKKVKFFAILSASIEQKIENSRMLDHVVNETANERVGRGDKDNNPGLELTSVIPSLTSPTDGTESKKRLGSRENEAYDSMRNAISEAFSDNAALRHMARGIVKERKSVPKFLKDRFLIALEAAVSYKIVEPHRRQSTFVSTMNPMFGMHVSEEKAPKGIPV